MRSSFGSGPNKSIIRRRQVLSSINSWWWGGGSSGQTPAQIADAFETRLLADGGTFEAQACLEAQITELGTFLNDSSFVLTPNGVKSGKIYALKPTNGTGDLSFTRSTTGFRKTSTYLQEMGIDWPRLDYLENSCPSILLEPQRTNLLLRSNEFTNAGWTKINTTVAADSTTATELSGADNLFIFENYAYVTANTGNALSIFDISNRDNPVFISKVVHGGSFLLQGAIGIYVKRYGASVYAFVTAITSNAITVVDVTNPAAPTFASSIVHGAGGAELTSPWNLDIVGTTIYVVVNHALEIIDGANPLALAHLGSVSDGTNGAKLNTPLAVKVVDNLAHIASFGSNAYQIIDVTIPAAPGVRGNIDQVSAPLTQAHGVILKDGYSYIAARGSDAVSVYTFVDPDTIVLVESIIDGEGGAVLNGAVDFQFYGNYLVVTCYEGNAVEILDATNPLALVHVGSLVDATNLNNADMVWVHQDRAYCTCFTGGTLTIINIFDTANPAYVNKAVDGVVGSYNVLETTANNVHILRETFVKAASSLSYVCAFFVKGGLGRDWICMQADDGTNVAGKFFNITTGALGNDRTAGSGYSINDSRIIDCGDEGYLCLIRVTTTTSTTFNFTVLISTDGATITYVGDVTKGFVARKAKVIQSASPLTDSYVTTVASTVARNADVVTPLTSASALIGQSAGTLFFWVGNTWADSVSKAISVSDGTANNRIIIDFTSGNVINALVVSGGVTQATISNASFANNTEYKVAVTYQTNKAALFVNGTKIGEDLTVTVPACDRFAFDSGAGSNPFYGGVEGVNLLPTALSDADAQTLTTI